MTGRIREPMRGVDSQDQGLRNGYRVDGVPVRIELVRAEKRVEVK